jgi:hypothetical protein
MSLTRLRLEPHRAPKTLTLIHAIQIPTLPVAGQAAVLPQCTQIILRSLLGSLNPKAEYLPAGLFCASALPMPPRSCQKAVQRELLSAILMD